MCEDSETWATLAAVACAVWAGVLRDLRSD